MHDVPTNIAKGVLLNIMELPVGRAEDQPKEEQEKNVKIRRSNEPNPIRTMLTLGVAEFIGTALLLFLGCMGCIPTNNMPVPHHLPVITFGLSIMLIIQLFGHISGGHLNPAVTVAAVVMGHLKPMVACVYIAAQFVGSTVGFGLLKILIPAEFTATEVFNEMTNHTETRVGLCTTEVHPKMSVMQALAIETIITSILILVCCAVWDKRNSLNTDSLPLRFGLIIAALATVAGPFTGASMNMVRSFAPAIFNNNWEYHWIYWVGPTLGAVAGSLFYKTVFDLPKEEEENFDGIIPLTNISK